MDVQLESYLYKIKTSNLLHCLREPYKFSTAVFSSLINFSGSSSRVNISKVLTLLQFLALSSKIKLKIHNMKMKLLNKKFFFEKCTTFYHRDN